MAYEGLKKGTFLEEFGTMDVELYAHARPGGGSLYVLTDEVVNGYPRVFQVQWDPVDYMAVARNISPGTESHYYIYFLPLEHVWRLGGHLQLSLRGQRTLKWRPHGRIRKILFDETAYGPVYVPRLLQADVFPWVSPPD